MAIHGSDRGGIFKCYIETERKTYHIGWIYDIKSEGVDGDEDLGVVVDEEGGEGARGRLDLTVEESAAIVREGPAANKTVIRGKKAVIASLKSSSPAKLQVLLDQSLWRRVCWYGLELFDESVLRGVLRPSSPWDPRHRPIAAH